MSKVQNPVAEAKIVRLSWTEREFLNSLPRSTSAILEVPELAVQFGRLGTRKFVQISGDQIEATALGIETLEAQALLPDDDEAQAERLANRLSKNPTVTVYFTGARVGQAETNRLQLANAESKYHYNLAILSQYPDSKPQAEKVQREWDAVQKLRARFGQPLWNGKCPVQNL